MNLLLVGSGGREHALAWRLRQSPQTTSILVAGGNSGTAQLALNLPINPEDTAAVIAAAQSRSIDLVVIGPEQPLAAGIVDQLTDLGIPAFGPTQAAAQLEVSKSFARQVMQAARIGVVHAANFSLGVNLFAAVVERSAALFARHEDFGSWIHEGHHAAKRDTPSGTALALRTAMRTAGYERDVDVSSTRAGRMPGTHTVGYDGPFDTITLTHTARDRATFARGALEAARWVRGRSGWFSMRDVLGID